MLQLLRDWPLTLAVSGVVALVVAICNPGRQQSGWIRCAVVREHAVLQGRGYVQPVWFVVDDGQHQWVKRVPDAWRNQESWPRAEGMPQRNLPAAWELWDDERDSRPEVLIWAAEGADCVDAWAEDNGYRHWYSALRFFAWKESS